MLNSSPEKLEILLVEDNPGDVRLIVETLKDGRCEYNITAVKDGEEAMLYLEKKGSYAASKRPDIILLDLKLPRKSGLEVLREAKSRDDIKAIPIIVLTSSSSEDDMT